MPSVNRSILFPGGGIQLRDMAELARSFDDAGFFGVYCVEAYRSGFVPLTVLALATRSCRVGTYILNAKAHPPVAAAMAARDVSDVSQGRVVIGLGSGNPHINQHHLGASNDRPLARMREYVEGLRAAVAAQPGDHVQFEYDAQPLTWSPATSVSQERIPVYLAAMYPGMRRIAARCADGLALGSLHSPEFITSVVRPAVVETLVEAGRDTSDFRFVASALASVHADSDTARRAARLGLCRLFTPLPHPYYEYVLREQGWSGMVDRIAEAMREEDLARAVSCIPDEAVDSLLIAGTPEECETSIAGYDGVLDEILLTDATAVGASIRPVAGVAEHSLRALLSLAPAAR
jgi:alkanesulfonate monooxygenase SsuD/methylene tetrahydromethanopterin reductase-like flavin-dependent oxidoreductase (luciferase family)